MANLGQIEAYLNLCQRLLLREHTAQALHQSIANWTWRNMTPRGLRELIARTHTSDLQLERSEPARF
ncbi:hypothetical protein ACQAYK_12745 (plasmid) [Acidithiobacillus sp. AC3]